MTDIAFHAEQLREATRLLALITETHDVETLRQIAAESTLKEIKAHRRELTKPKMEHRA